jgi:glucokinase
MSELVLGIDLGGTAIKTALVTADRRVLAKASRPTNASEGVDAVLKEMDAGARDVLTQANASMADVVAAGIGAPGPMNWETGVVFTPPNLPGWNDVPLADRMTDLLGVPCYVDNDGNLACYGEFWMGAGQGATNMCAMTLGTGVGGGIVIDGKLIHGVDGTAGEVGHMKVTRSGRTCGCGAQGCLEPYGSVGGLVQTAGEMLETGAPSILRDLCGGEVSGITGKMVSDAAQQGDAVSMDALRETGVWLGVGISSLINLLNPEKIVLCGGMIAAGDVLFDPIRQTARERSFDVPGERAEIVPAELGADSGVLGAAGSALERARTR